MAKTTRKQFSQVLGHNARSLKYTGQEGTKPAAKIANNKLATKRLLQRAGLNTPRLYAKVSNRQSLKKFRWTKLPSTFVLKPKVAYGGSGIIVIFGRNKKGNWVKADKSEVFISDLKSHVADILDGNFSSTGQSDTALFEQRIKNHPDLKPYSVKGIADIRVIVFNKVPIMAMLRLPTQESHGKANLHAGGIGLGIDLSTGITTTAIYRGRLIETLPGKNISLSGIAIPDWQKTLSLAVKAADAISLPYSGVDIAIDRDDGPMVLEINAHPGLDIQLANMTPLRSRLQRVEGLNIKTTKQGVQIGTSLFGSDPGQSLVNLSSHNVLGFTEPIEIIDSEGSPHKVTAKIDTGAWRTTIDETLAKELGVDAKVVTRRKVKGALGKQERAIIELSIVLQGKTIKTSVFTVDRSHMKYPMIIGRRDLKGFLIDPAAQRRPKSN